MAVSTEHNIAHFFNKLNPSSCHCSHLLLWHLQQIVMNLQQLSFHHNLHLCGWFSTSPTQPISKPSTVP